MTRTRRPSPQTIAVLAMLEKFRGDWRYGLEISAATGLASGSLYPILARLDERGWLESCWLEPERAGRPPRHGYRITPTGSAALRDAERATETRLKEALA